MLQLSIAAAGAPGVSQRLDGIGALALGDEDHRAAFGVGGQGQLAVAAGARGLVNGWRTSDRSASASARST